MSHVHYIFILIANNLLLNNIFWIISSVSLHSWCRQISHEIVFRIQIGYTISWPLCTLHSLVQSSEISVSQMTTYIFRLSQSQSDLFCDFFSDCRHMPTCACLCLYFYLYTGPDCDLLRPQVMKLGPFHTEPQSYSPAPVLNFFTHDIF